MARARQLTIGCNSCPRQSKLLFLTLCVPGMSLVESIHAGQAVVAHAINPSTQEADADGEAGRSTRASCRKLSRKTKQNEHKCRQNATSVKFYNLKKEERGGAVVVHTGG